MSVFFTEPASIDAAQLEHGTTLAPRFDANGLVTAIAVEAGSNDVLMLAHMNAEALQATIESGFATYYSRSRKSLWKKGESSGELQKIVEIRVDCDQDAVLLIVEQAGRGAACHTGRKSCFFRRVELMDGRPALSDLGDAPLFDPKVIYRGE